jgi:hypothetical protein
MRTHPCSVFVALGMALSAATALAAGSIQVSYLQPERFTDIGLSPKDRDDTLHELTRHFESLATRFLVDGQTLSVAVLDIDLAGEVRPSPRIGQDLRVLRGDADWPRIKFRYSLQTAGQATRSGEQALSDMAYLNRRSRYGDGEPLRYEKPLLDEWFDKQFGRPAAK